MKLKYFQNIENLESLKKEYKRLVFELHPDVSSKDTDAEIKIVNNEYEYILKHGFDSFDIQDTQDINDMGIYKDIILKLVKYTDITIEIIGKWIWVSGNTYNAKDDLKTLKFHWAKNKKMWFFRFENDKSKNRSKMNIDDIRSLHGSKTIYSKQKYL